MENQFKFFRGIENDLIELDPSTATWMWDEEFQILSVVDHSWVISVTSSNGIGDFLNRFPNHFIVPIHSITGNGIRHSYNDRNNGNGWGFNISTELLTIEYYTLRPVNERI